MIIENGLLYTGDEVLSPATVIVEGETIVQVVPGRGDEAERSSGGKVASDKAEDSGDQETVAPADASDRGARAGDIRIDAAGRLVTPGLINAHTHIYSALARGMPLKDPAPTNFREILERLWWRLDRALTLEEIDLSARLHAVESLRSGVTTLFDHHASQRNIRGSLSTISRALADLGPRACLCFEVSDREGPRAVREGIEENGTFIEETATAGGSMRRARFGLHASFTLSDATLAACTEVADAETVGFHVHLAEGALDGPDAGTRLRDAGVLGRRTICVHGVHLTDAEIGVLGRSGAWLVHCPQSNMNNAVGAAPLEGFSHAGVRTALGTDGFTANIAREALAAHLLQNHLRGDPRAGSVSIPEILTRANSDLATETFGVPLGKIAAGHPADLVVWGYRPPTPMTAEGFRGHLLFGLVDAHAEEVIVAGRHVLQGGRATGCDEIELNKRCARAAERLWERL